MQLTAQGREDYMQHTILFADDDLLMHRLYVPYLERAGHQVLSATTGRQALSLAVTHLPDLILLDINLPMKSGHEVLAYIKNNVSYRHIAVIMLTTSSSEKDILRAYDSYVNCYITKPIDASDFMDAVIKIEDFWISIVTLPGK